MKNYKPLVDQIALRISPAICPMFGPAPEAQLQQLTGLRLPQAVLDFYRAFAPSRQIEGAIAIFTVAQILEEHQQWGFGSFTAPHGYIPLARTLVGDRYCFDLNRVGADGEPGIVLISHELVDPGITAGQLQQIAKPVAKDLHEFLGQFLRDAVDEETNDSPPAPAAPQSKPPPMPRPASPVVQPPPLPGTTPPVIKPPPVPGQGSDRFMEIIQKHLDRDFRLIICDIDAEDETWLKEIERIGGVPLPADFRGFVRRYGAIHLEAKESIWPRPKPGDIGPRWTMLCGFSVYGCSARLPEELDLRVQIPLFRRQTGTQLVPFLKIDNDPDVYCFDGLGKVVRWDHETGRLEQEATSFTELFAIEVEQLRARKDRRIAVDRK